MQEFGADAGKTFPCADASESKGLAPGPAPEASDRVAA